MMLRRCCFLGLCMMSLAATAQQRPVFDPLNPPESADTPVPARSGAAPARTPAATAAVPPAPAETMVVTPDETAAPSAAKADAVSVTPAPKPAAPEAPTLPRVVSFDALASEVGKSVLIKTNLRTQRKGVLKRFNRAVLIIEDRSRGFAMDVEIPRQTVVEITLLD